MSLESILKDLVEAINNNTKIIKTVLDAPPAATAPPAPATPTTPEGLNTLLGAELNRLGGRAKIDAVLKEFNVPGVFDLPRNQYQALIDKVRALCPGSAREEEPYPDIPGDAAIDGTGSRVLLELSLLNKVQIISRNNIISIRAK